MAKKTGLFRRLGSVVGIGGAVASIYTTAVNPKHLQVDRPTDYAKVEMEDRRIRRARQLESGGRLKGMPTTSKTLKDITKTFR